MQIIFIAVIPETCTEWAKMNVYVMFVRCMCHDLNTYISGADRR